jgi:hypothetical protein
MTQNLPLDYEDPVHEGFFDPIQELLGASAPSLNITVQNSTTLQIVVTGENDQQAVAVQGRYRYRSAAGTTTAALPGGLADGIHDVYVTASDNDFTGGLGDIDAATVYTFGLEIKQTATTPSTTLYRKVGEVQVASSAIVGFWQTVGQRAIGGQQVFARAEHASQSAVIARAAATPTVDIARVENSSGTALFAIDKDGKLRLGTPTIENASGSVLTLTGALKLSSYFAANGKTPAAAPVFTPTNVSADSSFDANSLTLHELADVVGTMIAKLVDIGLFASS